ncbi:L-alanine-DL-glutamate epimerase-like enolase superfamily enzyme [Sphingomonas kyeonggiensis]|uniref:N-acetyl-D-Glu racemase DgcA n=1 Tax=Sphingomonas kyeonggiensis TaxID=1268553 RepID=UPI00277E981A|nr:N-acetyl-D-Glu racemase DgcA [Sphingomonas kyeonggiensis]MDQ0252038.1 L-alanine-DL-glutamate epimerase-like enolase superfamily enzyme [Sphingomonas kyeonggiensis]
MQRTLSVRHDRFALTKPFRISRGVKTEADVVTVTIHAGDVEGWGEGVPYARYGESVESALAAIEGIRPAIEAGAGREELLALLPAGAARNAMDCALWDLEARQAGTSVAALIGAPEPGPIASALTIVIDTPMMMGCAARRLAHVPLLKVKVDARLPDAQIRAVRTGAPDARLIVDPNESWDATLVEAMQPVLAELKVDLLEQPVAAGIDACLETFRPLVPIAADESIHTSAELDVIAGRYQVVNVKLDKSGGLTEGLKLAQAARERGLGLMTGCMVSSSLSIAAALHIARMSDFVDLDGPIWLAKDRPGGVEDRDGTLYPPLPGFWGT